MQLPPLPRITPFLACALALATSFSLSGAPIATSYKNFKVSVYVRSYEVAKMKDPAWLEQNWKTIEEQVHVDHVYLEMYRDEIISDRAVIEKAKAFFAARGVRTSAGLALVRDERNRFETFDYTDPEQRKRVQQVVELSASLFDEIILDDFFFTNIKSESSIAARGDKSWPEFRLALMTEVAKDLILAPAKKVNPKVRVVIKFPNWYEHFQGCGYNLETQPPLFDGIYTGTETRDPVWSDQHLQPYLGYNIFRYFENIAPGRNGGGWVDVYGSRYTDRYAEQLWITLFAKAPEMNLFTLNDLIRPVADAQRAPWQGQGTSFDFDAMRHAPIPLKDGTTAKMTTIARAAGQVFETIDPFLGKLGRPIGVKSYRPFHSTGEDFLHNFLGMAGIPIDLQPTFPAGEKTILLTEDAKTDPTLVDRIEHEVRNGATVVITSGLLRALQGHGIERIAELSNSGEPALVRRFIAGWGQFVEGDKPVLIPEVRYLTNDSWELVGGITDSGLGYPLLTQSAYAKGRLLVLTIPDTFTDLYGLPPAVLNRLRAEIAGDLFVRLEGPGEVALYVYDNNTCIVESFHDTATDVKLVVDGRFNRLHDEQSGEDLASSETRKEKKVFALTLKPHSFRVFSAK